MDRRTRFRGGLTAPASETNEMIVRGYAVVFDELTDKVGFYKERIARSAFDGVDLSDVCLVVGHDFNNLLARSGVNLRMDIDEQGVWFESTFPDTQLARDTYELVKAGILNGCSFSFIPAKEGIERDNVNNIETITKIDQVFELTLTPIPAYPQTVAVAYEREQQEKMKKLKILEVI